MFNPKRKGNVLGKIEYGHKEEENWMWLSEFDKKKTSSEKWKSFNSQKNKKKQRKKLFLILSICNLSNKSFHNI